MEKLFQIMENTEPLTIQLPNRVTADNYLELREELEEILEERKPESFILDAGSMEYISSAGLRVLLTLNRHKYDFAVINVSPNVYEIFEITGFDKIIDVRRPMREMSIEGLPEIARGVTAIIYRIDKESIIKVYREGFSLEEIEKELEIAKEALLAGVATAISYDTVRVGNSYGTIYELIDAKCLADEMREHPEEEAETVSAVANFIKEIHQIKFDPALPSMRDTYLSWVDQFCGERCTKEEMDLLRRLLNAVPNWERFCHGDFHFKNIMIQNGEPILIDMGDVSCSHPIFDFMSLGIFRFLYDYSTEEDLLAFGGMGREQYRRVWDRFLREYFRDADEEELKTIHNVCMCYSAVRTIIVTCKYPNIPQEGLGKFLEALKELDRNGYSDLSLLPLA